MSRCARTILLVGLLIGAGGVAAGGETNKELQQLLGIWELETMSFNGELAKKPTIPVRLVILDNGEFVQKIGAKLLFGGALNLDAKAAPKRMDLLVSLHTNVAEANTSTLCLYQLDGDTLTLARGGPNKDRPTAIESRRGVVLQVYRRVVRVP